MSIVRGVDGCKKGWISVSLDLSNGEVSAQLFGTAAELFAGDRYEVLGIDMPIGLPDTDTRACDSEARKLLGPRRSSVFPVPVRAALSAATYEEACDVSEAACGRRLSRQTYAILPKIREVDEALRASANLRERVFEVHPELSFRAWNCDQPMAHPKKSGFGFLERLELCHGDFGDAASRIRQQLPRSSGADDDILDALAILWTARRIHQGRSVTVPTGPSRYDTFGLPMRMHA